MIAKGVKPPQASEDDETTGMFRAIAASAAINRPVNPTIKPKPPIVPKPIVAPMPKEDWGDFGDDKAAPAAKPAAVSTVNRTMAGNDSKDDRVTQMARMKEERKARMAQLKEQKRLASTSKT